MLLKKIKKKFYNMNSSFFLKYTCTYGITTTPLLVPVKPFPTSKTISLL